VKSSVAEVSGLSPISLQYISRLSGLVCHESFMYCTDRKMYHVPRKLQRGLSSIETCCKRWKIKINGDKSRVVYVGFEVVTAVGMNVAIFWDIAPCCLHVLYP
jgi:hypothetical protein